MLDDCMHEKRALMERKIYPDAMLVNSNWDILTVVTTLIAYSSSTLTFWGTLLRLGA